MDNTKNQYTDRKNNNIFILNSNKDWGGGEKWTFDTAKLLQENNYNVMIGASNIKLINKLQEISIPVVKIKISFLRIILGIQKRHLKQILKNHKTDSLIIIQSNDLKTAARTAHNIGIKNIIYRRAIARVIKRKWYYKNAFSKFITTIITNSEHTKKALLQNYSDIIPNQNISVIYNGIEPDLTNSHFKNIQINKKLIIGSAGRLSPEKGHKYLIDLSIELNKINVNHEILIAGEGSEKENLENLISTHKLEQQVKLIGFKSVIFDFLKEMDIFILPSISEGFGFVLIESMLAKRLTISFDNGSAKEIIQNGETGYVIDQFDICNMARIIKTIQESPSIYNDITTKAYDHVTNNFNINKSFREFEEVINRY